MDIKTNSQSAAKSVFELKPLNVDLDGFEKKYKVSNTGKIWSDYLQGFLKPYCSKGGYYRVKLNYGNKNKKFMVHRLVALSFIPNDDPDKKTQVDHINNIRTDNNVNNLRWVSPKQNTKHSFDSGNREPFSYIFTNVETNVSLSFSNANKACKYFGAKYQLGTINKYANKNIPVTFGFFAGWCIQKIKNRKVQRPSSAEEQRQASRNGNNPTDLKFKSRVLIWSNLNRNIKQSCYLHPDKRDGHRFATCAEYNGSYDVWSV